MTEPSSDAASGPQRPDIQPSHLDFAVVGIGASAGGLHAVQQFFEQMPADNGMAFVVVLHLSPDHQSSAGKLIASTTALKVIQLTEPVAIQANHIYVISPAQRLSMSDGHLRVLPPEPRRGGLVTIDLFFRDLADAHKERAFCVVLSGTGSDGAVGLSRIKEQGGVTLVQHPDDAEYDGMPQAAIDTRMVDFVLPVVELPYKIMQLWDNAQRIRLPALNDGDIAVKGTERTDEQILLDILGELRVGTGHDFRHYKRATVLRRIERRMQVTTQSDLAAYHGHLITHADETRALLDDMLIGVTNFFRDRDAFEGLEREVVAPLFERHRQDETRRSIRVWSAGTSTGEEAYSLAILLKDYQVETSSDLGFQVFASDIDERSIAAGRAGLYSEAIITDVSPARLRQYFLKEGAHYRVRKDIRDKVLFARHSLLIDPPFSQVDLIVCRNLLIYLDRNVQREILQMFHFALNAGGYLFLGNSESADVCPDLFAAVDKKNRIYRARATSRPQRLPNLPGAGHGRAGVPSPVPVVHSAKKPSAVHVYRRAVERFSTPSIVVTHDADILYISEGAARYLQYMAGEVRNNLLASVEGDVRLELRTAVFQAVQSKLPAKTRPLNLQRGKHHYQLQVEVHPFTDTETDLECLYVMFCEESIDTEALGSPPSAQSENQMLSSLDSELQRAKPQLHQVIEQAQASSEELKASNEEMQAVNEELRSASEELETSKEELQSINEELLTVNHELKAKVEETDQTNDYLSNLISSTDIATVFVDRNLRIKWFTPRATSIFSMLAGDAGRPLMDITHRLLYAQMLDDASQVFESLTMIEREIASSDGHWYIARQLPYRSSADQIDGIILTFIDITSRRAAEEGLRLSEERMLQADSSLQSGDGDNDDRHLKDPFFAVMSHELKHHLNLIQLNAQVARRLPVARQDATLHKTLAAIGEAVTSQARIIDDLMDVARATSGKLQLECAVIDLGALLREIENVALEGEQGCAIRFDIPAAPLFVRADATRIEQIVWNLVDNAIKFTPADGLVRVVAGRTEQSARIEVIDTGPGIEAQHLQRIFEIFSQANHRPTGRQRAGLGIGLAVVKQLAESHGGSVQVYSQGIGCGSRFVVDLPLCAVPQGRQVPQLQFEQGHLAGLKVLLVDDSADVLEALELLLEMEEAQVRACQRADDALAAAGLERFDLIISDIGMPGMDGHELLAALRQLPGYLNVPAVALTGYGAAGGSVSPAHPGFNACLGKPIAYDELMGTLRSLTAH